MQIQGISTGSVFQHINGEQVSRMEATLDNHKISVPWRAREIERK
jgi:hypothetical protein